jgi:dTDP-4-amino-4,6-dideoxygalactose transaminase
MRVPFFKPSLGASEREAVLEVLNSGWLTTGAKTAAFEEAFARYTGARHAVALNSCTAALHLALEAIGVRRGDLVLTPSFTFAATAEVVRYFDATPVLVDCDDTLGMDLDALEATLEALEKGRPTAGLQPPYGPRRALIPMHFGGRVLDMERVMDIARRFDLAVVEDAAHTLPARQRSGASADWKHAGTWGAVGCFSFYANKCITTGEGGMAITDDDALAQRMRVMSLHGMNRDAWKRFSSEGSWYYELVAPGFKYNLTDIAAALGLAQLARVDELWQERRKYAAQYRTLLEDCPWLRLQEDEDESRQDSWHLFPIRLAPALDRARVIEALKERGVGTAVHWMPLHLHPYYKETYGYKPEDFPRAAEVWPHLLTLPLYPEMGEAAVEFVCTSLREIGEDRRVVTQKA